MPLSPRNHRCDELFDSAPGFPNFPRLPFELRIKIWSMSLPHRLITITPKLDFGYLTSEVEIVSDQVQLRGVCRESRTEAVKGYTELTFQDKKRTSIYINWYRDTFFLDLPDECVNVDKIFAVHSLAFRSVQVFAIRMKSHCFWDLSRFLRQSDQIRSLIFVDDPERVPLPVGLTSHLYLKDLGTWGFVRGCIVDFSDSHQYFLHGTWVSLEGSDYNESFGIRQWELSREKISLVKSLIDSGDRYFLLLPLIDN